MAWDCEILKVKGDFGTGGAGHDVWEGAEMAMIFPSPQLNDLTISSLVFRTTTKHALIKFPSLMPNNFKVEARIKIALKDTIFCWRIQ